MVRYRTVGPNVDYLAREGGEQREISALIRERDHAGGGNIVTEFWLATCNSIMDRLFFACLKTPSD